MGSFASKDGLGHLAYGGEKFYVSGTYDRFDTNGVSVANSHNGNSEADAYGNITSRIKAGFKPLPNLSFDAVGMEVRGKRETRQFGRHRRRQGRRGQRQHRTSATGSSKASSRCTAATGSTSRSATYTDDGTDFLNGSSQRTFLSAGTVTKYDYQSNVFFDTEGSAHAQHTVSLLAESETDQQVTGGPRRHARSRSPTGDMPANTASRCGTACSSRAACATTTTTRCSVTRSPGAAPPRISTSRGRRASTPASGAASRTRPCSNCSARRRPSPAIPTLPPRRPSAGTPASRKP